MLFNQIEYWLINVKKKKKAQKKYILPYHIIILFEEKIRTDGGSRVRGWWISPSWSSSSLKSLNKNKNKRREGEKKKMHFHSAKQTGISAILSANKGNFEAGRAANDTTL